MVSETDPVAVALKAAEKAAAKKAKAGKSGGSGIFSMFTVVVIAIGYAAYLFVNAPPASMLAPGNEFVMKQVTASGKPWLILCDKGRPSEAFERTKEAGVFGDLIVTREGGKFSQAVMDCSKPLSPAIDASRKSIFEKYGIDSTSAVYAGKPIILLFANGKRPIIAPAEALTETIMLMAWVTRGSLTTVTNPTSQNKLEQACFGTGTASGGCILFTKNLKKGMSNADLKTLQGLAKKFRRLRVVWVDNSSYKLETEEGTKLKSGVYIVKRLADGGFAVPIGKKGTRVYVGLSTFEGEKFALKDVAPWASKWEDDSTFKEMHQAPTLVKKAPKKKAGPTKEEKAAERKRKRDKLAKERGHTGGSGGGGGGAAEEEQVSGTEGVDGVDEVELVDEEDE